MALTPGASADDAAACRGGRCTTIFSKTRCAGERCGQAAASRSIERAAAGVCLRLDDLGGDEALEQRAEERRLLEFRLGVDAQQVAGKTRVRDVDLRRFDQTLAEIFKVRRHHQYLPRRLQNAEPAPDARHAHPERRRKIGFVQDLPVAARDQGEEAAKRRQVLHRADGAHVALQVGLQIGTEPERGRLRARDHFRIAAAQQTDLRGFADRQGPKLEHCGASGHRLGDVAHQAELLRAGEEPLAAAPRVAGPLP
jgi:hypothetical protein